MSSPKISIIMAAYNAEKFIHQSIDSVLSQTYRNFELVIVNDCSTDKTSEVVESYSDYRIRYYSIESNRGPSYARNIAISQSTGDYITILDADDFYAPDRLQILATKIFDEDNCFVADDSIIFTDDTDFEVANETVFSQQSIEFDESGEIWLSLDKYFSKGAPNIKIMFPSGWVKERGIKYDEKIKFGEDLKLVIDLFSSGLKLKLLNCQTYFYRTNLTSITRSSEKPWDQLAMVQAYASEAFLKHGDHFWAIQTSNTCIKYLAFDKVKKRDFRGLTQLFWSKPYSIILLYHGIKETLVFRLKEGRINLWR